MLDPRTHQPTDSFQLYDGTRHKTHGYNQTWEATNSVLWPSKLSLSGTEHKEVEADDSGICSPPMWTTSPPHRKNHNHNQSRSLSPSSRTQAIARGQRELMEMVRNLPEASYELSLKDLVEHHHRVELENTQEKNTVEERNLSGYKREGSGKRVDKMARVKRNGNIDRGGFYLKMGFPFSFGSNKDKKKKKKKKKKNNELSRNSSSKVSPKPSGSEKEWWKKSPLRCRESDSGESSINSGSVKSSGSSSSNSSSRSNSRHEKSTGGGCWPFFRRSKNLTQK